MWRGIVAICVACLLFFVGLFIVLRIGVNLPEFYTALAVAAFLGIPSILVWGFRSNIELYLTRRKQEKYPIYCQKIGIVDNGIHYYKNRNELPSLESVLSHAINEIGFIGVTLEHISTQDFEPVMSALLRGVKVTALVLHPDSKFAPKKEAALGGTKDLKHRIIESMARLLEEKAKLPADKKNNFVIGTYDQDALHSIIVVDPATEHGWIKIESFPYGKYARDRPSEATTKEENILLFQRCYVEYNSLANGFIEHHS